MTKPRHPLTNLLLSILQREMKGLRKNTIRQSEHFNKERRRFVKNSALSAAGLAVGLGLPSMLTSCKPGQEQDKRSILDVAILGGGMAGLNCANHLLGAQLDFKVFEASKRAGGRILTHYNDSMHLGIYPEFGGDFIDSNHEDMLNLAKEFQLETLDLIKEQEDNHWVKDIFYFDNRKVSEKEIIKEFKKISGKIVSDIASLGENYDTPEAVQLDNMSLANYISELKCASWLKDLLDAAFIAEYGLDCEEQSTLNMLDILNPDTSEGFQVFGDSDERYRIKGGNSQLINKLVEKVGSDNILLNYQVKSVIEGEDGIYNILFENGESHFARKIVCTIPFTILRTIPLDLKGMTEEKKKCIDELGYGKNTKLVLGYDGQPWRSKENNAMGYIFTTNMTNGWDGSINRAEGIKFGAYVAYFGGSFSQSLCDESSKSPLAPQNHVWRTALPEARVNGFVNDIDKIFKHSKEKFLNKHVFVNWIEYPYVKASYSCYKPGQWTTIAGQEMVPVGNFYFAGEHCSELFQGFMNGAAETGRRVAEMILNQSKQ